MMPADQGLGRLLAGALLCFATPLIAQDTEALDPAFLEFLALEAESDTQTNMKETDDDATTDSLALASWLSWWEKPAAEEEKDDE